MSCKYDIGFFRMSGGGGGTFTSTTTRTVNGKTITTKT